MAIPSFLLSASLLVSGVSASPVSPVSGWAKCNSVDEGYTCFPNIARNWGMYSPFYSLASESKISPDVPEGCQITFVQALHRHGARYPTSSKNKVYSALIDVIQTNATSFEGEYAFLKTYNYSFGSDDLTPYGEHELYDAGIAFYNRYEALTRNNLPFIRASAANRVVVSAQQFISGFQATKESDRFANKYQSAPTIGVIISEYDGMNNTLNADTCTNFENSETGDDALATFANVFVPSILKRVQANLPGVTLNVNDIVYLMDLCTFDTVFRTDDGSELSPFCNLFTQQEWVEYNYYNTLNKYYGYGGGNYLGPANGIGFVNELIARMTHTPVHDDTTTNSTLDSNPATFPLNSKLYADFSHDNGLTPIFFALGLYNSTKLLSNTTVKSTQQTAGYSAGWSVPYGARSFVEMMTCPNEPSPLVRVLVNDLVIPLHGCKVDSLARCSRDDFINGLSFARSGGNWGSCFN